MSNILTYPGIPIVAGGDMMIISDVSVDGNPTRSVSVNQLGAYIGAGGGSGAGVTSFNTLVGALTLVGGTDITLGTVGNTITINSAAGGGTVTSLSTTVAGNSMFATVTNATTTPYTFSALNIDAQGRITGASSGTRYNPNEIGFFINRHPATSAIQMMWKAEDSNIGSTTFSIAEEGTITGAFIITASSNYWQASYRLTMDINVPVYYDIGGKQVVKTAYCKRIAPNKLQIEFFQETSSTAEILQRVDLVVADTSSQGVSPFNGIDLRVKRWFFGM